MREGKEGGDKKSGEKKEKENEGRGRGRESMGKLRGGEEKKGSG